MRAYPYGDKIVVKMLEDEDHGPAIVLPATVQSSKPARGVVVEVGTGYKIINERVPLEVQKGDFVLFWLKKATTVEIEGETLHVLSEADVIVGLVPENEPARVET